MSPAPESARPPEDPGNVEIPLLGPLGISPAVEGIYRAIIVDGRRQLSDFSVAERASLTELAEAGLVEFNEDEVVTLPVRVAVDRWIADQETAIQHARLASTHFAALQHSLSESFVELIRGRASVRELFRNAETSATTQLRCFDREPYLSNATGAIVSPVQASVASRGVRYRVLYDSAALENPGVMSAVRAALECGEEARVYHAVPIRMVIADDSHALLILPYYPALDNDGPLDVDALLVHPSAFLDALVRLFECLWALGAPMNSTNPGSENDLRQLLDLLMTGLTDASIARELQVSERTVHRRITRLHELLGTNTRFQLGVQAIRQGWI